jgi:hypothetical protein
MEQKYCSGGVFLPSIIILSITLTLDAIPSSKAQVISEFTPAKVARIDGQDLARARHVLDRFFAREKHPECYNVLFSKIGENATVSFVPKRPEWVVQEEQATSHQDPVCGHDIGYVLDARGNVIRVIHHR